MISLDHTFGSSHRIYSGRNRQISRVATVLSPQTSAEESEESSFQGSPYRPHRLAYSYRTNGDWGLAIQSIGQSLVPARLVKQLHFRCSVSER